MTNNFKSGFVSFIGRSNVGKSTLLNTILQEKKAIVSNKPQTTRNQIQGIYNSDDMQIIFFDTPGIHKHNNQLGRMMNRDANRATKETNIICLLAPCNEYIGNSDKHIIKLLSERVNTTILLLLTKVDLVTKEKLMDKINEWKDLLPFKEIIPISAIKEMNLDILLKKLYEYLPIGEKNYLIENNDDVSDNTLIKEIIREKILNFTEEEIPYSVAVLIESINYNPNTNITDINAVIVVERDSQKGIIIGKGGSMIKEIGIRARTDLESIFDSHIILKTFVKVIPDWRNNPRKLKELGYS
ncbi:GTPase Era [Spiroplasma endosymbiont of Aleiodes alternator]|uniref:GTPase Era n=1 Tax=Spiroplasma endosymbiont of Aleiodes alternator TaxID=3139329 RepID=UPI003CCAE48B